MITDPIADLLVRLGNAARRRQDVVKVPVSKVKRQILNILGKEGFILGYGETQEGSLRVAMVVHVQGCRE